MALDIDNIYDSVRDTIIYAVGDRLSKINTPYGEIPSIIRARSDGLQPPHDYITLDVENIKLPSGWLLDSHVDSVTGKNTFTILYEVYVSTKAYGDNSNSILQDYHAQLCFDETIRGMLQRDSGMSIHKVFDVKSIPVLIKTNHEERGLLRISFYIHDVIEIGGHVSAINGNGVFVDGKNILSTITINVNDNP